MSCPDTSPTLTRRTLTRSAIAGTGIAALTGQAWAHQIEVASPVPGTPEAESPLPEIEVGPTVASKAAELGFDVENMFRFVSEDVRYEPYAGGLRGANGTLWSLAGNSVDKAVLFGALLDEALVNYRFAIGTLDSSQATELTTAATPTAEELRTHYLRSFIAANSPCDSGALNTSDLEEDVILSAAEEAELDALVERAAESFAQAQTLAAEQVGIIEDALQGANITIPDLAEPTLPNLEVERHVWIQVADGPGWIDYLPAIKDGVAPGAVETYSELPDELIHTLTIRLVGEEFVVGNVQRRELVSLYGPASALVTIPVGIVTAPPSEFDGMGLSINQLFSGEVSLVPYMFAQDVTVVADYPIVFGSDQESVLGALDDSGSGDVPGEGETLGLWLEVDLNSPGAEPFHVERALMDRIGAERRLEAAIDFTVIEPVTVVDFYDGTQTIAELAAAHLLTVDVARLPFSYSMANTKAIDTYGEVTLNAPAMTALRDGLRLRSELPAGFQTVIGEPQLTLTSLSVVDAIDPESPIEMSIDLLRNRPQALRTADPLMEELGHPAIVAGVFDQMAEQMLLRQMDDAQGVDDFLRIGPTVATIFDLAVDTGIPIATIASTEDLTRLELDHVSISMIERALAEGWYAIAPVRPVAIGDAERAGWWLIDPATGQTRDQLDSGRSYASLRIPTGGRIHTTSSERGVLSWISRTAGRAYRFLGRNSRCVFMAASLVTLANGAAPGASGPDAVSDAGDLAGAAGKAGKGSYSNYKKPRGKC